MKGKQRVLAILMWACLWPGTVLADTPSVANLQPSLPEAIPAPAPGITPLLPLRRPQEQRYFPLNHATFRPAGLAVKLPHTEKNVHVTAPGAPLSRAVTAPLHDALQAQKFHDIFDAE